MIRIIPLILLNFLLLSCQKDVIEDLPPGGGIKPPGEETPPEDETDPPEDETDCYTKDLKSLSFDFESATSIEDWARYVGGVERKFEDDIQITSEEAIEGSKSCKFRVSPESVIHNGPRAELTFDQFIEEGDETFYEYSVYIPENYQESHVFNEKGHFNFQVLGQWHDKPDECLGQDWDDYPSGPPPVAIYYNYITQDDPSYIQYYLNNPDVTSTHGFDKSWNEVSTLKLVVMNKNIAFHNIPKGEWLRLRFHIKWSRSDDGFIQGWINGKEFTNGKYYGSNMMNKASHYFKFGLYRMSGLPSTNEVYYDDINIY
jgi:hypothetical protein